MIVSTRLPLQGRAVPPQGLPPAPCPAARRCPPPSRQRRVAVHSFQFFKSLGLKKPAFLPDFGRRKREAVLQRFFGCGTARLDAVVLLMSAGYLWV